MACAAPMNLIWISDLFLATAADNSLSFSDGQNALFRRLRRAPKRHGEKVDNWVYCAALWRWEREK